MIVRMVALLTLVAVATPAHAMSPMRSPTPHGAMQGSMQGSAMKGHDAKKGHTSMKHATTQGHDAMKGRMSSPEPKATP